MLHRTMVIPLIEPRPNQLITLKNTITRHPSITMLQYLIIIMKMNIMSINTIMHATSNMNTMKNITYMNTKSAIIDTVDIAKVETSYFLN